jgi:hypothetical protein
MRDVMLFMANQSLRLTRLSVTSIKLGPIGLICLAGIIIEALLALRVWAQLTSQPESGVVSVILGVSGLLVAPFRGFEGSPPLQETGILEFATILAIEAYLVGWLAAVFIACSARVIAGDVRLMLKRRHN